MDIRKAWRVLKLEAARRAEQRQVAGGDPYADLGDVLDSETGRGLHFERDGGRKITEHGKRVE